MQYLTKPWNHQKKAVETALAMPEYGLFFEQGCGKTFTAINVVRAKCAMNKRLLKTLVICPAIVVENWRREFTQHSKITQVYTLNQTTGLKRCKEFDKRVEHGPCVFVMNFEGLGIKDLYQRIYDWQPEMIIVDESQRIKSYKAIRTKKAITLGDRSDHRLILTGTPILQSPMDLFSQYRFLDKGKTFGSNFFQFRAKYFYDKNAGMPKERYFPNWLPLPSTEKRFNEMIYRKASRVLKSECLDLPPLIKQRYEYELKGTQKKLYMEMAKHFIAYLNDKTCIASMAMTKGLRLQQIVCGIFVDDEKNITKIADNERLKALEEVLDSIGPQHKIIIWAAFRANYDDIGKLLEKLKINYTVLYGGMTDKARTESVDRFNQDPDCRVFIGNAKACGLGVNLTAASYSVYYSKTFSLEDELQSEARNHRGGSEIHEKITRIDLVAKDTIDDRINDLLSNKANLAENILAHREKLKDILPKS